MRSKKIIVIKSRRIIKVKSRIANPIKPKLVAIHVTAEEPINFRQHFYVDSNINEINDKFHCGRCPYCCGACGSEYGNECTCGSNCKSADDDE